MTSKWCGLCQRLHYFQATPEIDAPRRETARDFVLAFGTWALIVLAYIMGGYAVWAMVQ